MIEKGAAYALSSVICADKNDQVIAWAQELIGMNFVLHFLLFIYNTWRNAHMYDCEDGVHGLYISHHMSTIFPTNVLTPLHKTSD